jgi:hypothetical protein
MDFISSTYDSAVSAVHATPAEELYTSVFGDTPFSTFMTEWFPLSLTVILPVLCILISLICLPFEKKSLPRGIRVMKKIGMTIRADVRWVKSMSESKMRKIPKDLKGTKISPVKGKAEEEAIKKRAAEASKPGGKGGRFY